MMNSRISKFLYPSVFLFVFSACDSQVTTQEDAEVLESLKTQEIISTVRLIENTGETPQKTCSPQNSIKLLVTQENEDPLLCRDATSLNKDLKLGPVCSSGPEISKFTASSDWVDCHKVTVCGKSPAVSYELSSNSTGLMKQYIYSQLPWGCEGDIEVRRPSEQEVTQKIPIQVAAPVCPTCSASGTPSCALCGVDTDKPVIMDVFAESFECNVIRIIVFADDANSGLHAQPYSFDDGKTWQADNFKIYEGYDLTLAANQIRVRDRALNILEYNKVVKGSSSASCDCQFSGSIIRNGQSKTVYASSEVACGTSCQQGTVSCKFGKLEGNVDYKNLSCAPKICKCTTSWGQQLAQNETASAYKVATLSCDSQDTCDGASNKITIQCKDAAKNLIQITSGTGPIDQYKQPSCSMRSCGCVFLGVLFKPETSPLKVYKADRVSPPSSCELSSGSVTCRASGSSFYMSGDTNTSVFKYTQCTDVTAPGAGGSGTSPEVVGPGAGGGAGGGVGNGEGDGEGFRRRFSGGGGGGGCDVNKPPYYCMGGGLSVEQQASFCLLPSENGYTASATNSSDYRHRISEGGSFVAYSQKEVTCGDSCSKYMKVVSCDHGMMSAKTTHKYLTCREVCP